MSLSMTAIICTRNRERFLAKCLDSILRQSLPREDYTILVIDNGSTDGTADILREYEAEQGVRWLQEPVVGLSRARNTALKNVQTDYLGYIDDDAVAESGWMETALDCFRNVHPRPVWVGGTIHLEWETKPMPWINEELTQPLGRLYWGDTPRFLSSTERLGGGNSFFSRSFLASIGGFNEQLGRKDVLLSGEETELRQRIEAKGCAVYYHPQVAIRHFVPEERTQPGWFYRRYFWGGISDYIQKHSAMKQSSAYAASFGSAAVQYGELGMTMRLIRNTLDAFGVASNDKGRTIRGRIYWCYVIGFLAGCIYRFYLSKKSL